MFQLEIEGYVHWFYFAYCNCMVHTLAAGYGVGRCGRCGMKPFSDSFDDKEVALEEFREYRRGISFDSESDKI